MLFSVAQSWHFLCLCSMNTLMFSEIVGIFIPKLFCLAFDCFYSIISNGFSSSSSSSSWMTSKSYSSTRDRISSSNSRLTYDCFLNFEIIASANKTWISPKILSSQGWILAIKFYAYLKYFSLPYPETVSIISISKVYIFLFRHWLTSFFF